MTTSTYKVSYDDARTAVEATSLSYVPEEQKSFSRDEVKRRIHRASLNGFNKGAHWAQFNPLLAGSNTDMGQLVEEVGK